MLVEVGRQVRQEELKPVSQPASPLQVYNCIGERQNSPSVHVCNGIESVSLTIHSTNHVHICTLGGTQLDC